VLRAETPGSGRAPTESDGETRLRPKRWGYLSRRVNASPEEARPAAAPKADLVAPLAALAASTQDLALQLVAFANDRSADPARCAEARAALRPIDDLRAANARRVAHRAPDAESAPAETDAPLPAV
jgi:hypothetical protein